MDKATTFSFRLPAGSHREPPASRHDATGDSGNHAAQGEYTPRCGVLALLSSNPSSGGVITAPAQLPSILCQHPTPLTSHEGSGTLTVRPQPHLPCWDRGADAMDGVH